MKTVVLLVATKDDKQLPEQKQANSFAQIVQTSSIEPTKYCSYMYNVWCDQILLMHFVIPPTTADKFYIHENFDNPSFSNRWLTTCPVWNMMQSRNQWPSPHPQRAGIATFNHDDHAVQMAGKWTHSRHQELWNATVCRRTYVPFCSLPFIHVVRTFNMKLLSHIIYRKRSAHGIITVIAYCVHIWGTFETGQIVDGGRSVALLLGPVYANGFLTPANDSSIIIQLYFTSRNLRQ